MHSRVILIGSLADNRDNAPSDRSRVLRFCHSLFTGGTAMALEVPSVAMSMAVPSCS